MKKKFLKFLLLGVFTLSLGTGFVGCKDYDDDIDDLQAQIDELRTKLNALDLTSLKADIAAAKAAADEAYAKATAIGDVNAVAKAAAEKAIADAKLATIKYVDDEIADALKVGTGGGLTEAAVNALIDTKIATINSTLNALNTTTIPGLEANATGDALAQLKLQAAVLKAYGTEVAELNALIADLTAGTKTYKDVDWTKVAGWVTDINPGLDITNALSPLKSLAYIPTWYDNGNPAVIFYYINDIEAGDFAISSSPELTFRVNPSNAKVDAGIEWSFLNRAMLVTRAEGDSYDLVSILKTTVNEDNSLTFKIKADHDKAQYNYDLLNTGNPVVGIVGPHVADFIALRAEAPVDPSDAASAKQEIVSDYIKAWFAESYAYIGDTVKYISPATSGAPIPAYDYFDDLDALKAEAVTDEISHFMVYNEEYNLNDYVFASVSSLLGNRVTMKEANISEYYYKFKSIKFEPDEQGIDPTDQSFFVDLNETTGALKFKNGTAAINRTPIFQADLIGPTGKVIARHYFKIQIVDKAIDPITVSEIAVGDVPYLDLYTTEAANHGTPGIAPHTDYTNKRYGISTDNNRKEGTFARPAYADRAILTWQKMNTDVYAKLGLSHLEFLEAYNKPVLITDHTEEGPGKLLADRGVIDDSQYAAGENTGTVPVQVWIHPQTRFGAHTWKIVFTPKNASKYPNLEIPVTFNLTKPVQPDFDPSYVANIGSDPISVTKGKMINGTYRMQATLEESFYMNDFVKAVVDEIVPMSNTSNPMVKLTNDVNYRIRGYQAHLFAFGFDKTGWTPTYLASANEAPGTPLEGEIAPVAAPTWTQSPNVYNFRGQDIFLNVPINVDSWTFNVKFRSTYENMEDMDVDWKFQFQNPITVSLRNIELDTELAADVEKIRQYLTVKMLNETIYADKGTDNTNAKATTYGFPNVSNMPWSIKYSDLNIGDGTEGVKALYLSQRDNTTGTTADFWNGGAVNAAPFYSIYWNNAGTKLLADKTTEKISVTVSTSYASRTADATIVLKKTKSF